MNRRGNLVAELAREVARTVCCRAGFVGDTPVRAGLAGIVRCQFIVNPGDLFLCLGEFGSDGAELPAQCFRVHDR